MSKLERHGRYMGNFAILTEVLGQTRKDELLKLSDE